MVVLLAKTHAEISNDDPNPSLFKRLNQMQLMLNELDILKDSEKTIIPIQVMEAVDNGINIKKYKKDQLQLFIDKNQKTKGRIESLCMFQNELKSQIELKYPDLFKLL